MTMKEVPQDYVNSILENVGFDTSETDKQAAELRSATQGKHTAAPAAGNPDGETAKLPSDQNNSNAAQSATGEGSGQDEGVEDSGGSPDGAQVDASQGKGSPELPDVTVDYKEGEKVGHAISDSVQNLSDRLKVIEEALSVIITERQEQKLQEGSKVEVEENSNVLLYCEATGEKHFIDNYQPEMEYFDGDDNPLTAYNYEKDEEGNVSIIGEAMKKTVVSRDRGGSPTAGGHKDGKAPGDFENLDYENPLQQPTKAEGASADLSAELKKVSTSVGSAAPKYATH